MLHRILFSNEIVNQLPIPEEGKLMYWILGILVAALAGALTYVRAQHKEQIKAKDDVILSLNNIIDYERSEKSKYKDEKDELVKDFYNIFQNQDLVPKNNRK